MLAATLLTHQVPHQPPLPAVMHVLLEANARASEA
jgi:hypothetical protein